jgi:hypothetical protein
MQSPIRINFEEVYGPGVLNHKHGYLFWSQSQANPDALKGHEGQHVALVGMLTPLPVWFRLRRSSPRDPEKLGLLPGYL